MIILCIYSKYHARLMNWKANKKYRVKNKYLNRWVQRFNPESKVYVSSMVNIENREFGKLSVESKEEIGKAFVHYERKMKNGLSRYAIVRALEVTGRIS